MAPATRGQILTEELTLQATRTRWFVGVTFEMLLATLGAGQGRQTGLLGGPGGHRRAMGKKGSNFRGGTIPLAHPLSLPSSHTAATNQFSAVILTPKTSGMPATEESRSESMPEPPRTPTVRG